MSTWTPARIAEHLSSPPLTAVGVAEMVVAEETVFVIAVERVVAVDNVVADEIVVYEVEYNVVSVVVASSGAANTLGRKPATAAMAETIPKARIIIISLRSGLSKDWEGAVWAKGMRSNVFSTPTLGCSSYIRSTESAWLLARTSLVMIYVAGERRLVRRNTRNIRHIYTNLWGWGSSTRDAGT